MNRMLGRLMSLIAVPVLAACASSGPQLVQAPTPQQQPAAAALHYDSMYMAQVEQVAKSRGVRVKWINPRTLRGDTH